MFYIYVITYIVFLSFSDI